VANHLAKNLAKWQTFAKWYLAKNLAKIWQCGKNLTSIYLYFIGEELGYRVRGGAYQKAPGWLEDL
jgi:hypothetical protein